MPLAAVVSAATTVVSTKTHGSTEEPVAVPTIPVPCYQDRTAWECNCVHSQLGIIWNEVVCFICWEKCGDSNNLGGRKELTAFLFNKANQTH